MTVLYRVGDLNQTPSKALTAAGLTHLKKPKPQVDRQSFGAPNAKKPATNVAGFSQ